MKIEYRIPFVREGWTLMKSTNITDATRELDAMGPYGEEAQMRNAETKKRLQRPALYGYNGGVRCDTHSGPCACGAWH